MHPMQHFAILYEVHSRTEKAPDGRRREQDTHVAANVAIVLVFEFVDRYDGICRAARPRSKTEYATRFHLAMARTKTPGKASSSSSAGAAAPSTSGTLGRRKRSDDTDPGRPRKHGEHYDVFVVPEQFHSNDVAMLIFGQLSEVDVEVCRLVCKVGLPFPCPAFPGLPRPFPTVPFNQTYP